MGRIPGPAPPGSGTLPEPAGRLRYLSARSFRTPHRYLEQDVPPWLTADRLNLGSRPIGGPSRTGQALR